VSEIQQIEKLLKDTVITDFERLELVKRKAEIIERRA